MKHRSISLLFVIVALALVALIVGDFVREARSRRRLRETILAELQPVALKNCTLKRFGSANDGGYLMCENLIEPIDAAYSYGVGSNDDWGCEVSRRYHVPVHVGFTNRARSSLPIRMRFYPLFRDVVSNPRVGRAAVNR